MYFLSRRLLVDIYDPTTSKRLHSENCKLTFRKLVRVHFFCNICRRFGALLLQVYSVYSNATAAREGMDPEWRQPPPATRTPRGGGGPWRAVTNGMDGWIGLARLRTCTHIADLRARTAGRAPKLQPPLL